MTEKPSVQHFQAALQKLESDGDDSDLLRQFADGAELHRPEVDKSGSSTADAKAFWAAYKAQFSRLRTEFAHVHQGESFAALEWTSTGTLTAGRDIEYSGVSLLTFGDDGRIGRFATYYDTAAFVTAEDIAEG